MLSICTWKWGHLFSARHVNKLRAALDRHVHLDHRLYCITDNPAGLDGDIHVVPMPERFAKTPRCRRRMQQYDRQFASQFGTRTLTLDLDVVIVDDLTPLLSRTEPIVCWKVGHAQVYSGSFVLCDVGALHLAWVPFAGDPDGYPRRIEPRRIASDQAMLNYHLSRINPIPFWTEADGFVTYYGAGYEKLEAQGVGPNRSDLPPGARIVVLGSADLSVLDAGTHDWVREHWTSLPAGAGVRA